MCRCFVVATFLWYVFTTSCIIGGEVFLQENKGIHTNESGKRRMSFQSSKTNSQKVGSGFCKNGKQVHKKILKNGMAILVRPSHTIPNVSMQIWYNVGAKDEVSGHTGIAHLIEHMIFKGTQGKNSLNLSESDINVFAHKLSGSINAFTSNDYTGYLFNMPSQNWKEVMPVMADCMEHAAFKDEHINSEMRAVLQELKLYRDVYGRSLVEAMLPAIFSDHPYSMPLIGYKSDLQLVKSDDLREFYKKHYLPNNATLVVVGDVEPEEVFKEAEKYFGHIKSDPSYKRQEHFHAQDVVSASIKMYRDVKQPIALFAYPVQGLVDSGGGEIFKIISWILGRGRGSRLYDKVVNELKLATSFDVFYYPLFDQGIFFFIFEPKQESDIEKIKYVVQQELSSIVKHGLSDKEIERAQKNVMMNFYNLLESSEGQAREIGKYYTALGDAQYAFNVCKKPVNILKAEVQDTLKKYFRSSRCYEGVVLPLAADDRNYFLQLQEESDKKDVEVLAERIRQMPVEPPVYAKKIQAKEFRYFSYPKPCRLELDNGARVLYLHRSQIPKLTVIIDFKARYYYDSNAKPGLYSFLTRLMMEGTKKYTARQLADELESRAISLDVYPGGAVMTMLGSDLEKGLEILNEILSNPRFDKKDVEKVRDQQIADVRNFWDEPRMFAGQLLKETVYKNHPYGKNMLGTEKSIKSITLDDLKEFHKKYISPVDSVISIVGDLDGNDFEAELKRSIGTWSGKTVEDVEFPQLRPIKPHTSKYYINRDQVVLCFGGISVKRKNADFDKLLLFDQIFGSGELGSMSSRLFELRERSGLFYSIQGTTLAQSSEQPGMVFIKTLVSLDRLDEAKEAITNLVETVIPSLTEAELDDAKGAVINSLVRRFENNSSIAQSFIFLDRYDFPDDFFDKRSSVLSKITLDDVKTAASKYLDIKKMFTLSVGRVGKE